MSADGRKVRAADPTKRTTPLDPPLVRGEGGGGKVRTADPTQTAEHACGADGAAEVRVFISAAEASADQHAAGLIRAVHEVRPDVRFVGVAGPKMVEAGCDRVFDMTGHSAMLLGVLGAAGRAMRMRAVCDRVLREHRFDAVVVLDSPTLHLSLAAKAHALNIPVLYYIAPQLWAWGTYRLHRLRNDVDRVAAILPFEEAFFRSHGIEATYVGHPLAEAIEERAIDEPAIARLRERGHPLIALLPGSRRHVVEEILPGQLEVADAIASAMPRAAFGVSVAGTRMADVVREAVSRSRIATRVFVAPHDELIEAADLVLVASGTTTLEVAFRAKPMIVMYNASRVFYHLIARWMLHTPHLSLPNILAGREIVPEFMPYYRSTKPIAECAIHILRDESVRKRMSEDLEAVVLPLRGTRASQRTAQLLMAFLDQRGH